MWYSRSPCADRHTSLQPVRNPGSRSLTKAKIVAEVKGFDPTEYIEKRECRRMDLYCQYAIAAASQAVKDSGIEGKIVPERFGCYVG